MSSIVQDKPRTKSRSIMDVSRKTSILLNILFSLFCISCILPIVLVISVSLSDEQSLIQRGFQFFPTKISTIAYQFLFNDFGVIWRAYGITIFTTIVGTALSVILIMIYAYPLSRKDFPFKKFFSIFILITMLFGGGLVPFYLVYVQILHLRDSIWALILPHLGGAFWIFIVRTFYQQNIPEEMIESAKIDGAGELRLFVRMVIPLSLPVMATIGLFTTFGIWNDWFNSLLFINNDKLYSLQYVMMKAMLQAQFIQQQLELAAKLNITPPNESIRMAMVLVGMGPIIIAYPFFQKYFIKGMTVGAVKG